MTHRRFFVLVLLVALGLLVLSACNSTPVEAPAPDHGGGDEHGETGGAGHAEVPGEFASMSNPFAGDVAAIEAGGAIYAANCATCHGPEGGGDGPSAAALDPKPSNLADANMMAGLSDGYLFWRISEGGMMAPFNSTMPPWKGTLTEDEIWQVVTYVRSLSGE